MRGIVLISLMGAMLLLAGGCRTKANTPGYEEQQLQAQYENLAAQLTMQVNELRDAVDASDWSQVDQLQSQQEDLFQALIETEDQLAALGATPNTDLGQQGGVIFAPPILPDNTYNPQDQAKVDSLWAVVNLIEDAVQSAATDGNQAVLDDLIGKHDSYSQELSDLLGKPTGN